MSNGTRAYEVLLSDLSQYDPRLIMTGGGMDLSAPSSPNLLGKGSPAGKAKEKRDVEGMVGEMMESIARGGDYSNAGYESANWAGQYSDMDVAQRGAAPADTGWGQSFMEAQLNPSTSYDASTGGTYNPYRQEGGPVQGGQSYVVGEQGPETFVPNQSGTIIPNFATDINSFWNELFSPRPNMEFEQANQQPPLMPRDSNIGGITPVPQSPTPWTR